MQSPSRPRRMSAGLENAKKAGIAEQARRASLTREEQKAERDAYKEAKRALKQSKRPSISRSTKQLGSSADTETSATGNSSESGDPAPNRMQEISHHSSRYRLAALRPAALRPTDLTFPYPEGDPYPRATTTSKPLKSRKAGNMAAEIVPVKSDTMTDLHPLNMRVRTLTHILKLVTPHITKSPTLAHVPKASRRLRLLDRLSLLLVRDREITAILPIRSNAQDATRVVVICGDTEASDVPKGLDHGHGEEELHGDFCVTRNPREELDKHVTGPARIEVGNPISDELKKATNPDDKYSIIDYVLNHWKSSWIDHCKVIETLLNVLRRTDPGSAAHDYAYKNLKIYVLCSSAGKMSRRFTHHHGKAIAASFKTLNVQELREHAGLGNTDDLDVGMFGNEVEKRFMLNILNGMSPKKRGRFQQLSSALQITHDIPMTERSAPYNWVTIGEWHDIYTMVLDQCETLLVLLTRQLKKPKPPLKVPEFPDLVALTKDNMENLFALTRSPLFKKHVELFSHVLDDSLPLNPDEGEEDQDYDGGPNEILLAVEGTDGTAPNTKPQRPQNQFQKWLELTVSYQKALKSFNPKKENKLLPPRIRILTIRAPLSKDWQTCEQPETVIETVIGHEKKAKEMIGYLRMLGDDPKYKGFSFFQDRKKKNLVKAFHHAEASLGTLRYHSCHWDRTGAGSCDHILDKELQDVLKYAGTYIGVSKRCCPVCTLILDALAADVYGSKVKVSYTHENWYTCSLPIGLPVGVAKVVVAQLESKVRVALTEFHRLSNSTAGWRSDDSAVSPDQTEGEGDSEQDTPCMVDYDDLVDRLYTLSGCETEEPGYNDEESGCEAEESGCEDEEPECEDEESECEDEGPECEDEESECEDEESEYGDEESECESELSELGE